jgi:hypothetical protein
MSVTPCGFARASEKGLARLHWNGSPERPSGASETYPGWAVDGQEPDIAALRPVRGLEIEWPDREVPLAGLVRLAAAGVPLTATSAPAWVPPELATLLTDRDWLAPSPDGMRSVADLRREEHSVRLRRLTHRVPASRAPQISVVMSTRRPDMVAGALAQMARQREVGIEILLGLHGIPFERVRPAVESCPLPVTWIEASAATPFGEVLNEAAAPAAGDYLAKWDDDDWYGPDHLADLVMAASYSGADIVGAAGEFFYLEPLHATIRRTTFASGAAYPSEVFSEHVAGGTILASRAIFRDIGGFPAQPSAVDRDFLKAAHEGGATIYRTHGLGYVLRRALSEQHTWQLPLAHFLKVAANQWRGFRPSLLMEAA